MKKLIHFTTLLLCLVFVGLTSSCSDTSTTIDQQNQAENSTIKPEKELEKAPPLMVQQFGGCKAHQ